MANVLQVPLAMAQDSIELAKDVTMGVLFSRGPALVEDEVTRLCLRISAENRGVIAMSAVLSPNTFLLLGQGDTIDRFKNSPRAGFYLRCVRSLVQRRLLADVQRERSAPCLLQCSAIH